MTAYYPLPVNTSTSSGFSMTAFVRPSDPYDTSIYTWTEITSSMPVDMGGFYINSELPAGGPKGVLLVATGSAGSENIIATVPFQSASRESAAFFVPIAVASGTRISLASASSSSATVEGQTVFMPASDFDMDTPYTVMETGPYDFDGGSSDWGRFVEVDTDGLANSLGPWTEASITSTNSAANNKINGDNIDQNYRMMGVMFNSNFNSSNQNQNRLITWGEGASGAEVAFGDPFYHIATGSEQHSTDSQVFWIRTEDRNTTSERHAFRLQSSITDVDDRKLGVLLFGLR